MAFWAVARRVDYARAQREYTRRRRRSDLPLSIARSRFSISEIPTNFQIPSLKTFYIEFDRSDATYTSGELVTGNVILELTREETIRALKLFINGKANVSWGSESKDSQERTQHEHFRASEQYLDLTYHLSGQRAGNREVRMPAGFHKYPFNFVLPHNIPCSFEHENGHIRYTTKAIIGGPLKFEDECKATFTVVTPYDLNAYSQQCLGIDDEIGENFYSFCCWSLGSIKVHLRMARTGFVPGQPIEAMVNFNNNTNVNVTKICVKLERALKFYAESPYNTTKTDKSIVKSTSSSDVDSLSQFNDILSYFTVPNPMSPSHLEYCSIIDQKYNLRITFHVSGMHCSISRTYPILIGTIPLRSAIPSVPYAQIALQPTAPPMEYDDPPPPMPTSPDYEPPNVTYPGQAIDFVSPNQPSISANQWDIQPPSYAECIEKADSTKE